ncbi:hypothetical protein JQV19_07725 [Sulfitobacter mediterraneus]|uniref:hypothetical protein n=1 Tax=Sulfitobacter mediterraneus TaxID=83219 RepID=UPI001939499A|nr:hypothetical protein [Sulfitobacter mediterraneus]MBM1556534.1 hypothetical protein [Sulfitobacter mediterraneus]MBM1569640.1 hypothetical protein [Sulfitobacter mediterraneus]MBM1573597.1 hypothetical protein [Sulfitobacter mediterraneus]MBM1577386.1 hypothetical protein [Sulfitobacter mediterraneus]MBM1579492.1 hypothetical protein [Sulfitobacter mediterraneus]
MIDQPSHHTRLHADAGPGLAQTPVLGMLSLFVLVGLGLMFGAAQLGLAQPGIWGASGAVVVAVIWIAIKVWRRRHLQSRGEALQAQLHDLKQEEFRLKFAQAQQDGSLRQSSQDVGANK